MVEPVSVLLAVIAAGIGIAIGWLVNSKNQIERVSRAEATVEAERATNEERLMQFENAASKAFAAVLKDADGQKESAFKDATEALSSEMSQYIKAVQDAEKGNIQRNATLGEKVDNFNQLGLTLTDETRELTLALRGDSQAQGAWGEVVVENFLQGMGLVKDRDYFRHQNETDADGKRMQPDFVLNLPNNRQVVMDSKVSLTAYTEYQKFMKEGDSDAAQQAMKAHCTSIATHAKGLASKNYEHMGTINTLDFVLMVIPIQSAHDDAMRANPRLFEAIVSNPRVKVVTGATFMVTLHLIQDMWMSENQSRNQIALMERGGHLHDKMVKFFETYAQVGHELSQTLAAYEASTDLITNGRGNIIWQTEKLRELGVKVKRDLRSDNKVKKLAEEAEMNEHAISPTEMVTVEVEEE